MIRNCSVSAILRALSMACISLLALACKVDPKVINRPFVVGSKVYGLGFFEQTKDSTRERPGALWYWTTQTNVEHPSGQFMEPAMIPDGEVFWSNLREAAQANGRLTIFVHGYDTSLQVATHRARNLDATGPVLLVKWANPVVHGNWITKKVYAGDTYDRHAAIASDAVIPFAKVLNEVASRFHGIPIFLVGHSHGSRLLINAFSKSTLKADRMALIEADAPASTFEGENGFAAQWLSSGRLKQILNYASTGDPAMGVSRLHNDEPILGSLHRSVNPPVRVGERSSSDPGNWPYMPVDIGCWKGQVRRGDSFYGHSEFFYSMQLIAHFRFRVLGMPVNQTIGDGIREEIWPQNDRTNFPTIRPASGPTSTRVVRIREVGCECKKEGLGKFNG